MPDPDENAPEDVPATSDDVASDLPQISRSLPARFPEGARTPDFDYTSTVPSRPPSPDTASTQHYRVFFILAGVFRVVKDLMTFLVRGGLSTLMFLMDQFLSLILIATNWIPDFQGGVYLDYLIRLIMWTFQVTVWIVYTSIELIFYLPSKFLVFYLLLLAGLYLYMPNAAHTVLAFLFRLGHSFLHLVKYVVYDEKGFRDAKEVTG